MDIKGMSPLPSFNLGFLQVLLGSFQHYHNYYKSYMIQDLSAGIFVSKVSVNSWEQFIFLVCKMDLNIETWNLFSKMLLRFLELE
jgi:hypothetical protein